MLYVRQGRWQQVGELFEAVAGRLHGGRGAVCFEIAPLLLQANAPHARRSHREALELQHLEGGRSLKFTEMDANGCHRTSDCTQGDSPVQRANAI